jgi:predicted neuraminidase
VAIDRQEGFSFQNPVPFETPTGEIWLMHTVQPADQGQKDAHVLLVRSLDQGETWTPPKMLFEKPGAYLRNRLVVRPDGAWLLPMYFTPRAGIADDAQSDYPVVMLSHDRGTTWSECTIPNANGYVQPSVVRQGDHYVAFFRSRFADHVYRAVSADGCKWSAPAATRLPNNNASIQAIALKDGRIAIAFNNTHAEHVTGRPTSGPRVPLTVAISADEGQTWVVLRDIERGRKQSADQRFSEQLIREDPSQDEYSYPSILQAEDGSIYVAFTYQRKTIKVVQFRPEWISAKADD